MIAVGLTVFIAFLFIFSLWLVARGRAASIKSVEQLTAMSKPVDLEAFRNLASVADENYLRASLPGRDFRRVQRMRMRGALEYVGWAAHNSSLLIRLGESGRQSQNPEIAHAAAELANSALQMRLLCLAAGTAIIARIVFPELHVSVASVCERYAETRERVVSLGRIESPALVGRIESAL
jgi:hypothetical protein